MITGAASIEGCRACCWVRKLTIRHPCLSDIVDFQKTYKNKATESTLYLQIYQTYAM